MEKYTKDKTEIIRLRLNDDFKAEYLKLCDEKGQSLSKRLRWLMEEDMKNNNWDFII
jgi:hypothetical protein